MTNCLAATSPARQIVSSSSSQSMLLWVASWEGKKTERGGGLVSVVSKVEGIPRLEEGFEKRGFLDMTWRKGKCVISIMVCPLKELDTSALSASPRRLIEGVLEVEGPTSADAEVASCLLFDTEPVFRRLRDDFCDGKIFDGMIGTVETSCQSAPWECLLKTARTP